MTLGGDSCFRGLRDLLFTGEAERVDGGDIFLYLGEDERDLLGEDDEEEDDDDTDEEVEE